MTAKAVFCREVMEALISTMDIIISNMNIIIPILSFIVSAIALIRSNSQWKKSYRQQQDFESSHAGQFLEQMNASSEANRSILAPFFIFDSNQRIYTKERSNPKQIILPIQLTNIGQQTAVNIQVRQSGDKGAYLGYFETLKLPTVEHRYHAYLEPNYAQPNESVSLSAAIDYEDIAAYQVKFTIQFRDIIGRIYTQSFCFQYSYPMDDNYRMDTSVSIPELQDMQ